MRVLRGLLTGLAFVVGYVAVDVVIWPAVQLWWETRKSGATGSGGIGMVRTSLSMLAALIAFAIGFLWQWFR